MKIPVTHGDLATLQRLLSVAAAESNDWQFRELAGRLQPSIFCALQLFEPRYELLVPRVRVLMVRDGQVYVGEPGGPLSLISIRDRRMVETAEKIALAAATQAPVPVSWAGSIRHRRRTLAAAIELVDPIAADAIRTQIKARASLLYLAPGDVVFRDFRETSVSHEISGTARRGASCCTP